MGWIKDRIDAEYRKHYKVTGGCDWSLIAEKKILTELKSSVLWNSSLEELWKDDDIWDKDSQKLSTTEDEFELNYCPKCIQMTNHYKDGNCAKCSLPRKERN